MKFEVITDKCVGCMACVRVCDAQAIEVDGDVVRIDDDSCILSGACLAECPHDAIGVRGDLDEAVALASSGNAVLILSVESAVHFYPRTPEQVVNACYAAGFRSVERGVVGDELVAEEYLRLWSDPDWGTLIRSTSPLVVQRIRHDHPELVPYLAPIKTPLRAEADYLKKVYGEHVKLVYAGVFMEESSNIVDASLTFSELEELFRQRAVMVEEQSSYYNRLPALRRRHVSAPGGFPLPVLLETRAGTGTEPGPGVGAENESGSEAAITGEVSLAKTRAGLSARAGAPLRPIRRIRGLDSLGAIAHAVTDRRIDLGFVDLLPYESTLDHPLLGSKEERYWRRQLVAEMEPPRSTEPVVDPSVRVEVATAFDFVLVPHTPTAQEIEGVIEQIGRAPTGMDWDCGACGYPTCAEFATAMLKGRAAFRQCPPYQERRARVAIEQSTRDELTGLATIKVLRDRLEQEKARSGRNGEQFAVLFVDMDDFKLVNDFHGHEMGSKVLAGVGKVLLRSVRQTDLAARYGGDEFVVVLVMTDTDGARRVGEVVRESVESLGESLGFARGEIAVSVGVACHDPGSSEDEDVMEAADRAMYQAKGRGGNIVVVCGEDLENQESEQH